MTARGFRRAVPAVNRGAGKPWAADPDAVNLLLIAFGYPTIPPAPRRPGKVHHALETDDDDDQEES